MFASKLAMTVGALTLGALFSFGGGVKGNGNVKEEAREVGDFSGVRVSHSIQATVTVGPKRSVKLEAEENLLPLIKTELKDGQLVTRVEGDGISPTKPVRLIVVTPTLTAVGASGGSELTADGTTAGAKFEADASGGSTVKVKGVNAQLVEVEASGASHVTLSGTGKDVTVQASGAAGVKLAELTAESLKVHGSGAARVHAQASVAVEGHLSGGAELRVKGNPQRRDVSRSGGASVSFE